MKRIVLSMVILMASSTAALAAPSYGDIGKIYLQTTTWAYQYGNGGEFRSTVQADNAGLAYNSVLLGTGSAFSTFCVEENENVSGGNTFYWAQVNTSAVKGGVTGGVAGGDPITGGMGDPLDTMTAYLFTKFSLGTLSGYDFGGPEAARELDARHLQNVIWYIEGEVGSLLAGQATTWYNEALEATTLGGDNQILWSGLGNVRVLNLYSSYNAGTGVLSGLNQDILVHGIPAPGAALLGLMGVGLVGWIKRRFA